MATKIFTAILIVITSSLWAQNCDFYIPLVEGKGYQYQNFNRRDRLEGTNEVTIKQVSRSGTETEAVMGFRFLDDRNRLQHEGEYKVYCKGNELQIDISSMLDQAMLQSFEGMEVTMSNIENITIPSGLRVGQKLPDARMDIKVTTGAVTMNEMNFTTQNRTVESRESITTPAGTFDCFKITYENVVVMRVMGIRRTTTSRGVEYFTPGVGNVRSEFYDDRGRLQSYTVLSKIL